MKYSKQLTNLMVVVIGFAALGFGARSLWAHGAGAVDLAIFAGMYLPTAFGITAGYHRLFAHRSYEACPWVRYALAMLGSAAVQGPVIEWVADHRKHHAFSDREGDPHSPHVGHGEGWLAAWKGFWHAHEGWFFRTQGLADRNLYAADLLADPIMRGIDRANGLFVIFGLAIPFGIGYFSGGIRGGAMAMLWGGFFRVALMHHATFSVNSLCHLFGRRPFRTADYSGNLAWLALPTLGESWHHNHHAFPKSAFHGLRWWQLDPTGLAIRSMRALGLVWNVTDAPPELQRRKAV